MGGMDTLTQLGVAGGVLLIFGLFLLGLLRLGGRLGKPVVESHVKTMDAFRDGQVQNTKILSQMGDDIRQSRKDNAAEHRAIMDELRHAKGLPTKTP